MKRIKNNIIPVSLFLLFLTTSFSCNKEMGLDRQNPVSVTYDNNAVNNVCGKFNYPDSIFYLKETATDYIVKPLKVQSGTYGSFPSGLSINPVSGAINVTKSETGLRYIVWFVPGGSSDTCKRFITISGINYLDSIYTLKPGVTTLALPVFNAKFATGTITARHGGEEETEAEYDDGLDDDDKDGFADEPPAGQQIKPKGVALNKSTGRINLNKTVTNGVFGTTPVSGAFRDFILNYRIYSDSSKGTLNKLTLRMYYFKNKASIPLSLRKEIKAKRDLLLSNNSLPPQLNLFSPTPVAAREKEVKCRPAYIIITGR